MPKFEFCIPTVGKAVPASADWFREIKYDGYRLRIERDEPSIKLITRGGQDWTKRFPWIAEAGLKNRRKQFVIDGEAVILRVDGVSDFDALHSGKANLERLLRSRPDGIFINPFETGAIGPHLYRAACGMGLEGIVSKRGDRPYRAGRSPYRIKVKNRAHHSIERVLEAFR